MSIVRIALVVLITAVAMVACKPDAAVRAGSASAKSAGVSSSKEPAPKPLTRAEFEESHKADAARLESMSSRQRSLEETYLKHREADIAATQAFTERLDAMESAGRKAFEELDERISKNSVRIEGVESEMGELWREIERVDAAAKRGHAAVVRRVQEAMDGGRVDPAVEELRRIRGIN